MKKIKSWYFGLKYKENSENKYIIEEMNTILGNIGIKMFCVERDLEKYGNIKCSENELMKYTFEKIDESDTMLIDVSEKGIGLGIECGYGYAKKKRIIVIHKKGTELSTTIKGISSIILEYKKIKDVAEAIKNEHI